MDFPPVSALINATFDPFGQKADTKSGAEPAPKSPQPVASSQGVSPEAGGHSSEQSGGVGSVLNTVA